MLAIGNIQNCLRKLQTELRFIKFRDVDYQSLQTGNSCEFLKIYHYIFVDFNSLFAKTLLDKCQSDFYGKTDSHFIDTMYKTLRDYFNYKPPITKEQFFTMNFTERKLQMAYDIIILIRRECKNINAKLNQPKRSGSSSTHDTGLKVPDKDAFVSMEQAVDSQDQMKLKMTINHLEEQVESLKLRIGDINERLNNITSILQDTHLENNSVTSSDLIHFNARLLMIENELILFKTKSSPQSIMI